MLLNEIPLLHHGDHLGGGGEAEMEAEGDADFDLSFLIRELGEMGFVDGEDEEDDEELGGFSSFLHPRKASSSPTSNLHFMDAENFVASRRPFSSVDRHHRGNARPPSSLFDPFPFSSTCFDAAAADD